MITSEKILLLGGTGSLSQEYVKYALENSVSANMIVFSRDEYKQYKMKEKYPNVEYILGDIRDYESVFDVIKGVEIVINFAALKQIDTLQHNTLETVSTNIYGTKNIARACKEVGIWKAIQISTDKSFEPSSIYGYTKAIGEKIFLDHGFSIARLGNVIPSRGCFIWKLNKWRNEGIQKPEITKGTMIRFGMERQELPEFISDILYNYSPGKIYIPELRTFMLSDMVKAFGFEKMKEIGMRDGEKRFEVLFDGKAWKRKGYFVLNDEYNDVVMRYTSENVDNLLTIDEIKERLERIFEKEELEGV